MTTALNLAKLIKTRINNIISSSFSERYLLCTNVGLSVMLSGLGDWLLQYYEIIRNRGESWDRIRTRNMSTCGMTIGIFCHYWYNYLDRRIPGYSVRVVIKKVVIDQVVCSPVCIATLFLTSGALERKNRDELLEEIKRKSWKLYAAEWAIWPPAQFINFYFLPTKYRVLYDNSISLGYDIFTSYVKHNDNETS